MKRKTLKAERSTCYPGFRVQHSAFGVKHSLTIKLSLMARMKQPFDVTGTIGKISIYKVRGSDEPVVRTKGGPTKRMVKTRKSFAATRRNNSEFGGRARMTSQVMEILRSMKYLGDYNLAGPLNSLFIPIQAMDIESEHGQRNIELTKNPGLLEGFNLNRRTPFSTIITNSPEYTLSKETLTATVTFPALIPGVNFFPAGNFSSYKLMAILGVIENVFYHPGGYGNAAGNQHLDGDYVFKSSDWITITPQSQPIELECNFRLSREELLEQKGKNNYSCLLAIGIAFGAMDRGQVEMVKYVGGGKILAMG
ncbi:hypothetical protein Niako_2220 [Niastella koreensis GR20-10]|uniref:Uncharacterized protein n=3 Tax=Niastella koreensis TaxID=354356 RepID=G8THY0_NIAKG|nr:hypothetical protein Niako_2220 [Niastella koreensis GR20-10]